TRAAKSFDHLVGAGEQRWRHGETEYPCRRVIDDKLELGGLHDRQVRRFRTLEDATRIDTDLTICIRQVGSVAHQAADFGIFTRPKGGRERVARRSRANVAKAASMSRLVLALRVWICRPMARVAVSTSLNTVSTFASAGLTSTATRRAAGTSSRRSSTRLAINSLLKKLMPVALPPGRARLATRPSLTGSSGTVKTIGIVVVAALAASAGSEPPVATITATCRRINSVTSAGTRSI